MVSIGRCEVPLLSEKMMMGADLQELSEIKDEKAASGFEDTSSNTSSDTPNACSLTPAPPPPAKSMGMSRAKSLYAFGGHSTLSSRTNTTSSSITETSSASSGSCNSPAQSVRDNEEDNVDPCDKIGSSSSSHHRVSFHESLRRLTHGSAESPTFSSDIRKGMEPYLRIARYQRECTRTSQQRLQELDSSDKRKYSSSNSIIVNAAIASSMGVPYTALRKERPFLFDYQHTHPLHVALAEALNLESVDDLSNLHTVLGPEQAAALAACDHQNSRVAKMLCRGGPFHQVYDNFVTAFCIPLLHSLAMSGRIFHGYHHLKQQQQQQYRNSNPQLHQRTLQQSHHGNENQIIYRYQAFPTVSIRTPGSQTQSQEQKNSHLPTCDTIAGHSIGCLRFHIPLTRTTGTSCLFTESHPGREDWHPLEAGSGIGLGYLFDGARCLSFHMENTTEHTSVALDFRILIYSNLDHEHCHDLQDYERGCQGNTAVSENNFESIIATGSSRGNSGGGGNSGLCSHEQIRDRFSQCTLQPQQQGEGGEPRAKTASTLPGHPQEHGSCCFYKEAVIDLSRNNIPGMPVVQKLEPRHHRTATNNTPSTSYLPSAHHESQ